MSLMRLSLSAAASCFVPVPASLVVSSGSVAEVAEDVFLDDVNVTNSSVPTSLRKQ